MTRKPILAALTMPPLRHWPNQMLPFDISNSQVIRWLTAQPEVQQWLFDTLRSRKLIVFDAATGLWHGAGIGRHK